MTDAILGLYPSCGGCGGLDSLGQMVDQTALYAVLGLTPGSDRAAVRDAYRALARQLHPDVNRSAGAADRMRELNAAYHTLRDGPASPIQVANPRTSAQASSAAPFGG